MATSLTDTIKKRMFAAMKAGNTVEKEILRVALGEITTQEGRTNHPLSDADVEGILRKLVKSNREALDAASSEATKSELAAELEVLGTLLPQSLSVDEIVAALAPVADAVREAPSAGPAMGIAMKQLKSAGAITDGKDVNAAVARIRG